MASLITISSGFSPTCTLQKSPPAPAVKPFHRLRSLVSSASKITKPLAESLKTTSETMLEAVADTMFKFVHQNAKERAPFMQGNFGPVDEIGDAVLISATEGEVPDDFPQGVYIRNGANPFFSEKITAFTPLGEAAFDWFQGDGMVHATYFNKDDNSEGDRWCIKYKNKYVESDTFLIEQNKNKPVFLPSVEGQPAAVFSAMVLNLLRFGKSSKDINNTNIFEHAGKVYTIAENHLPYEIDPTTLATKGAWDVNGAWDRPFTSHPKKAPGSGELVIFGADVKKPHYVCGVISADGKKLVHKADLKFEVPTLVHELSVTENYNIIMDYPLRFGPERLFVDKPFIGHDTNGKCRIGVMPRYDDGDSTLWFDVNNHCTFHIINTYEEGAEVVIKGCRTSGSIIPGPDHKVADKSGWYKRAYMKPSPELESEVEFDPLIDGALFARPFEWRLNLQTGRVVKEAFLTTPEIAMDFPTVNSKYFGRKNKYAYTQVVDSVTSANRGISIYNMIAKLYFEEKDEENEEMIRVEYHKLEENNFLTGLQFVERPGSTKEDDGWLLCYVHNETSNISHVRIVDTNKLTEEPVAKIVLPQRVPYGFHGAFICK